MAHRACLDARGYSTHFDIGEDMQGGPSPVSALGDGVNKVYEVMALEVCVCVLFFVGGGEGGGRNELRSHSS